jgi:pimeloyl-ACP methyl ester carboxylesterase
MKKTMVRLVVALVAALVLAAPAAAGVGTTFPAGFQVPVDASLGVPVLGFGAAGAVAHTPVVLLHGNNDTPYPTTCNPFGSVAQLGSYLITRGYAPSEVWALGYQGDQCDLPADQTRRSGVAHSTAANVADLRAFVHSVLAYTGAKRVDIVGHSLGATLARAWMKEDNTYQLVRRLVSIDGPNHGIISCSPNPANYWQAAINGGFTPDSAICREYGAENTTFLSWLNHGNETQGPTRYLALRNADTSFVYFPTWDGFIPPVPAEDRNGLPHDFSQSARLNGPLATNVDVTGQGMFDPILGTAHLGILASPGVWKLTADFLLAPNGEVGGPRK